MSTYVGKFFTAVSSALDFNTATLSGAMDIVVIEGTDGVRKSTPFHVRFGKLQLLKSRGIPIDIDLNGSRTHLRMLLGAAGEAYFYNPPPETSTSAADTDANLIPNHHPDLDSFPTPSPAPADSSPNISIPMSADSPPPIIPLPLRSASFSTPRPSPVTVTPSPSASSDASSPKPIPKDTSPTNETSICRREESSPTDDYHFSHGSDSEVELTRTLRVGASEVVDGPRSPPALPSTTLRKWQSSALPTSTLLHNNCNANTDTLNHQDESCELDNSALFNLPESPRRDSNPVTNPLPNVTNDVMICAPIHDIAGEEDRKLDFRSVDGYDADDDVDGIDGLQRHVSRVLSTVTSVPRPQEFNTAERTFSPANPAVEDESSAAASETDPPSDRDDIVVMSLCGSLLTSDMQEHQISELFERHRVSLSEFAANPNLLFHPTLLFRIDNRIMELRVAAPLLFAALAFNQRLDVDLLAEVTAPRLKQEEVPKSSPTPRRFGWFGWSSTSVVGEPLLAEDEIHALDANRDSDAWADFNNDGLNKRDGGVEISGQIDAILDVKVVEERVIANNVVNGAQLEGLVEDSGAELKSEEEDKPGEKEVNMDGKMKARPTFSDVNTEYLSFTPTTEQLKSLDLKRGANTLRFYVEASSVELNCRIFLWSCHSKVVISDVDGTITRSDVLGHLLPAVGRDWSQVGVAGLYTQIEKNGYKLLYLTARPIGQASQTRTFLHSVTQGSAKLPNGPVLMSPNRLVESFTREVIRRKPHEFKIAALREVRCLFSPDYNPFHAGFGNRDTDVISYRAVGLIPQRIFVVNPRGELEVMRAKFESAASYSTLQDLVERVFPDISGEEGHEKIKTLVENSTYNDWNYWRGHLPELDFAQLLKNT